MGARNWATISSSTALVELGTESNWFCPKFGGNWRSVVPVCALLLDVAGRGDGLSRVRGLVVPAVGCLLSGGGWSFAVAAADVDDVKVCSVAKERTKLTVRCTLRGRRAVLASMVRGSVEDVFGGEERWPASLQCPRSFEARDRHDRSRRRAGTLLLFDLLPRHRTSSSLLCPLVLKPGWRRCHL